METVEILILKASQLHLRLINLVEKISNMLKRFYVPQKIETYSTFRV